MTILPLAERTRGVPTIGAIAVSTLASTCFWLFWLSGHVDILSILGDIGNASLRAALILLPAIAVERALSLPAAGLPGIVELLLRGLSFTLVALSLSIVTQSLQWFLSVPSGGIARVQPKLNS